jgi:hypothetical protein
MAKRKDLLMIVEGDDDEHVFYAICEQRSFEPEFPIKVAKGIDSLFRQIPLLLKPGTDLERIGVVVDADRDLKRRWAELQTVLSKLGYANLPEVPDPLGTIVIQEDLPRLGVWIWPDNALQGTLEDFLTPLVPKGDVLWAQASKCLDEATTIERRFPPQYHHKALIHTYLAWQDDPGLPMGRAVTRGFFDPNHSNVDPLLSWLSRLFA